MPKSVEGLTDDQTRRIYRDFLRGVPREELMKKYSITEDTFWDVYGLYAKKKHPNDVGNAKNILGPTDPLVTKLDTGSGATENPIVAKNPRDMEVVRPLVVRPFDHDATDEQREKKAEKLEEKVLEVEDKVREKNVEATDATLEEIAETSESASEAIAKSSIAKAKSAPSTEAIVDERNRVEEVTRRDEAHAAQQRADRIQAHFTEAKEEEAKNARSDRPAVEEGGEAGGAEDGTRTGKLPDAPTGGSTAPTTPTQLGGRDSQPGKDPSKPSSQPSGGGSK